MVEVPTVMAIEPNTIAIIPARGGSKGIPRKNLKQIGGKPLIVWTIEAAKNCPYITQVVVSSDDDEILALAQSYGVEIIKRPDELASDTAGAKVVLQHTLVECEKRFGPLPLRVAYLQPTSPLRTTEHLKAAFTMLDSDPKADSLISVYEIDNSVLKASIIETEGYLVPASKEEYANMNRQMLPALYMPNGAIYIMDSAQSKKDGRLGGEHTLPFLMSQEDSIDLDTSNDFAELERLLGNSH